MMKTTSPLTAILILAFLALASELRADDPAPRPPEPSTQGGAVASFAIGAGPSGNLIGVASIQTRRGSRLFGVRIANSSEFNILGPSPGESDTDYGVLVGRYSRKRAGYLSASAGLSIVSSVRRGRFLRTDCNSTGLFGCFLAPTYYEKLVTRTLGVPFEAKAMLSGKTAGLGISVMGNLNPSASFLGAALTIELGSLR